MITCTKFGSDRVKEVKLEKHNTVPHRQTNVYLHSVMQIGQKKRKCQGTFLSYLNYITHGVKSVYKNQIPLDFWWLSDNCSFLFIVNEEKPTKEDTVAVEMQDMPQAENAELKFAQAIMEADLEAVHHGLKNNQLKTMNLSKIGQNQLEDVFGASIHPLDLAAEFGQIQMMDHILKYAFGMDASHTL